MALPIFGLRADCSVTRSTLDANLLRMTTPELQLQVALATEIRREMGLHDMSHAALARKAGISPSAYRHYFRTFERDLPMSALIAVAEALDVAPSELMARAERGATGE